MNTTNITPTLSLTEQYNAIIIEVLDGVITEAVNHFNQKRTRRTFDDERYFYKKKEVDEVLARLKHPEWVKVKIEYNIDGITPFCYTMDYNVIHRITRNKKNSESENNTEINIEKEI